MLRRWDDSQKYLSDNPHLVCEETANYLVIMCIDLEVEEVNRVCHSFVLISILNSCLIKGEVTFTGVAQGSSSFFLQAVCST